MKYSYNIALTTIGALLTILVVPVSFFAFDDLCGEELLQRVEYGPYVAEVFERNCGATTRYAYHVNIHKKDKPLKARLFSSGTITFGEVFTSENGTLEVIWVDSKHLRIETDEDPMKYGGHPPAIDGIQVEFVRYHPHLPPMSK